VQFGHAGSCANADAETAVTKNAKLREAGAHVPSSFDDLGNTIMYIVITLLYVTTLINHKKIIVVMNCLLSQLSNNFFGAV